MASTTTTHSIGDVVRLGEFIGTAAQRKQVWRITATPDPTASRKAEREAYRVEPIGGGRPLYAEGWMLTPGSATDKAKAAATPVAERLVIGTTVTAKNLRGATTDDLLVVVGENTDGTVKVAKVNGEGGVWSKVPLSYLRRKAL